MTLSQFHGMDIKGWVRELLSAVISGGASAISSGFAASMLEPNYFGVSWQTAKLMSMTFLIAAVLALMAFLAKKPLPPLIDVELAEELKTKIELLENQARRDTDLLHEQSHNHKVALALQIQETKKAVIETKEVATEGKEASKRSEHESIEAKEASRKAEHVANNLNEKIRAIGLERIRLDAEKLKEKE